MRKFGAAWRFIAAIGITVMSVAGFGSIALAGIGGIGKALEKGDDIIKTITTVSHLSEEEFHNLQQKASSYGLQLEKYSA
jgi:hypothetical protein